MDKMVGVVMKRLINCGTDLLTETIKNNSRTYMDSYNLCRQLEEEEAERSKCLLMAIKMAENGYLSAANTQIIMTALK